MGKLNIFGGVNKLFGKVKIYKGKIGMVYPDNFRMGNWDAIQYDKKDKTVINDGHFYLGDGIEYICMECDKELLGRSEAIDTLEKNVKNNKATISRILNTNYKDPKEKSRYLSNIKNENTIFYYNKDNLILEQEVSQKEFEKMKELAKTRNIVR